MVVLAVVAVLVSLVVALPVLVRLAAVVWRRWVLALLVLLVVVVLLVVSLVVVVWHRWVLAVLGIVVRRRGRCGVVRMMWCVWMPWRSVVLR